jgi:hypothetical protein
MPNRLWAFKYDYTTSKENGTNVRRLDSAVPLLVPPTTDGYTKRPDVVSAVTNNIVTVNVARDFPWTYTKAGDVARAETPRIYLKEKRLKTNAFISSILYSFGSAVQGAGKIITTLKQNNIGTGENGFITTLEKLRDAGSSALSASAVTAANYLGFNSPQQPNSTAENVPSEVRNQSIIDNILNFFNQKAGDNNSTLDDPLLTAYKNLYPSVNTGWRYVFPYFDDYYNSSQNVFGEDSGSQNVFNLITAGVETLQSIAGIAGALSRPFGFSFQEKAKFYNFPSEGEEFSFTFPLINTGSITFDEVVKNWQLIYLLLYQNKPARIDRNIIEPPVFYEVSIPGQKFHPFCYITNIAVDFKGSRRELNFNLDFQNINTNEVLPENFADNFTTTGLNEIGTSVSTKDIASTSSSTNFTAIIPDAYIVKITLKSLVTETRNFMAYTVLGGQNANTLASITDLDKQLVAEVNKYLGNSSVVGQNTSNQPGANTPVNYTVGGWPVPDNTGNIVNPSNVA